MISLLHSCLKYEFKANAAGSKSGKGRASCTCNVITLRIQIGKDTPGGTWIYDASLLEIKL